MFSLHRLVNRMMAGIIAKPRLVVYAAICLVAAGIFLGFQVEIRTSRSELASADDPEQIRFDRLMYDFGGSQALIACVEAIPGAEVDPRPLRKLADDLANVFRRMPEVEQVFHRIDTGWFVERGLSYADPDEIRGAARGIGAASNAIKRLSGVSGFADFNLLLAELMRDAAGSRQARQEDSSGGVAGIITLLAAERRFLESPEKFVEELEERTVMDLLAALGGAAPGDGYLATRDGKTLFLMISPVSRDDSLPVRRALVEALRRQAESLLGGRPGFRVAFTGEPARVVEEMDMVSRDTWKTSLIAVVGVTFLTLLVFRWRSHSWLVLAALGAGVITALGAVKLELGYLNLITSSFISTLIGVGVAYGIHPVSEYELLGAHTEDPVSAVLGSYHRTGSAVTVAALTTSAAFFSVLLMQFRGFAELGLVAGVGVLLCLISSLALLPALLVIYGTWRHRRDRKARTGAASAPVDRLWVERGAAGVCRFPKAVTAVAILLTAVAGWAAVGIRFDMNILELLPGEVESVRYQKRMIFDSEFSPVFNMVLVEDLDVLVGFAEQAVREPTIAGFESVLRFLPADPRESREALGELSAVLERISLPETAGFSGREAISESLAVLSDALMEAADAAFGAGMTEVAVALEGALTEADGARAAVENVQPGIERSWAEGQQRVLMWARRALEDLRTASAARPPGIDDLPNEIRERFITRSGRYLGIFQPAGSVFEPDFLNDYTAACRRISNSSTGFPIVFHYVSGRITSGFQQAVVVGAGLVIVILLIDYRNMAQTLLALLPLAIGVVWMLGAMRLLGLSFNFANLVAIPLIIGVGIDNGVHMVHRLRQEGKEGISVVLRHTGRAILIASMTTMIGFGSLALASHRGLASLGTVLLLGVGSCLVTSTIVLPNFLVATRIVRK